PAKNYLCSSSLYPTFPKRYLLHLQKKVLVLATQQWTILFRRNLLPIICIVAMNSHLQQSGKNLTALMMLKINNCLILKSL
ncbi:hypothetical protein OZK63_40275, partial [Streptomyces sp. UMAF16]|nr:hypothetical protein [Streptomyces sp. UMAF16]